MPGPAVVVKNLSKRYKEGGTLALDAVSFDVQAGEIFGLIGADGAGKTTAFQILAGVMEATGGTVEVLGQSARDARSKTGYLTQRFSLYQDLSIIENLRYSAGLREVPEEQFRERSAKYLAAFDLEKFQGRLAGRLSGGMKQKLALSCALVANPEILILDEPTTGVDPVSRRDFWDTLTALAAEGRTILVATPYLDEAERCHRVAMIERGKIHDIDSPVNFRTKLGWTRLEVHVPRLSESERVLAEQRPAVIQDIQRFGDRLDVLVTDSAAGQRAVRELLPETESIGEASPTLENAFVATLRKMRGPESAAPFPHRQSKRDRLGETLLEARQLEKRFGDFRAVKNFDVTIQRGQIYGLLGANGAGKTTAIKMMCGLLAPNSGTVTLLGHSERLRSAAIRSRIGYMSQKFTLYDDLTIGENLDFYANLYGVPRAFAAARKEWVLEVSDLAGQEKVLTAQLPGGWKQRVAFGAAVMHEPDLIFLDEPTSGVDPLARRAMWRMINDLADHGAAILVVTHYLEEAEQCSSLGFMAAGEVLLEGSPGEVRASKPGRLLEVETDDTPKALGIFRERFGAANVSQFGSRLHLANVESGAAAELLRANGIGWRSMQTAAFSLEDVFLALIEERKLAA